MHIVTRFRMRGATTPHPPPLTTWLAKEQIYIYRYYGKESNMLSYNRIYQTEVQIALVIVFTAI